MFLEINDISTGTVIQEPLNVYSINFVFEKEVNGKYDIIYVLNNGLTKAEEFDTSTEATNRLNEIKEVNAAGSKVYTYKGSCTFANLPVTGNDVGDVWNITDDFTLDSKSYPAGTNVAWDGTGWDALAGSIDLSNYYTKTETDAAIAEAPTYKPFPTEFPTTGTTQAFLTAVQGEHLPAGSLYLGEVTFSDLPTGIANAEIEVSIYDGNVIWCDLRSSNVAPYAWQCNSHTYRGWEPLASGGTWGSITGTLSNQTDLANALKIAPIPTITDAHWTDAAREFIFADKPIGTYLVHNGSTGPSYDVTSRTNMSFRASTSTSSRVTVTAQWGIIYIIKAYNDAATNEVFGYALFANGTTDGIMEFTLQSITKLSSGYRVSFNNMMITNNNSPIRRMIRVYSSSSTYDVDDLVINTDGSFYRCTTAITTPEAFNSSHWTSFYGYGIDKYIKELISQIPGGNIPLEAGSYTSAPGVQMLTSTSAAANVASGMQSVAFGTLAQATQREAVAMGYNVKATAQSSFATGDSTQATGPYAFACGYQTKAQGYYSYAEGFTSKATNSGCHAEGAFTEANGGYSHAEGYYTIANLNQHAQGQYNISEADSTGIIHIVGNGTGTSARSNAHTLYNNGDAWFAGDVYVGSTSGTDKDAGSVKLAKESQLPNITSTTTDPGAGSTLADGAIVLVYE